MKKTIIKNKKELINRLIKKNETVLDVGFWGHDKKLDEKNWVHGVLLSRAKNVYGLDIEYDLSKFKAKKENYKKQSAEKFSFDIEFDVIFASDLIEHISNPGMFLDSSYKNLKNDGRLIITTPNCYNLFNIVEKFTKREPTVNKDHVCYYNEKTIGQLLGKNNYKVENVYYLYTLENENKESYKKKILNIIYWCLSHFTTKFQETLIVVAKKNT